MNGKKKYASIAIIIMISCFIISWIIDIKQGKMPYADQWNRQFTPLFAETPIYMIFRYITELGSRSFLQPMTMIMMVVLWIWYKDFRPAFTFGLGTLGAHVLNKLLKELIARERPSISVLLNAEGYSFPSGHAMVSIVCYGLLAYFLSNKARSPKTAQMIRGILYAIIFLIGVSRYIINVHFATDIITGYFIGGILLITLIRLYERLC